MSRLNRHQAKTPRDQGEPPGIRTGIRRGRGPPEAVVRETRANSRDLAPANSNPECVRTRESPEAAF
jgi:hypothetical protein